LSYDKTSSNLLLIISKGPAMLSHAITPLISEQDYLALEMHSDVRHEYIDGHIFAMTGASRRHNQIMLSI